jgi:hypothetical protein
MNAAAPAQLQAARVKVANPKLGLDLSFGSRAESSQRLTFHAGAGGAGRNSDEAAKIGVEHNQC